MLGCGRARSAAVTVCWADVLWDSTPRPPGSCACRSTPGRWLLGKRVCCSVRPAASPSVISGLRWSGCVPERSVVFASRSRGTVLFRSRQPVRQRPVPAHRHVAGLAAEHERERHAPVLGVWPPVIQHEAWKLKLTAWHGASRRPFMGRFQDALIKGMATTDQYARAIPRPAIRHDGSGGRSIFPMRREIKRTHPGTRPSLQQQRNPLRPPKRASWRSRKNVL